MLVNVLFSSIMLPCRPAGTLVDIKRTPWKKVSAFLRVRYPWWLPGTPLSFWG